MKITVTGSHGDVFGRGGFALAGVTIIENGSRQVPILQKREFDRPMGDYREHEIALEGEGDLPLRAIWARLQADWPSSLGGAEIRISGGMVSLSRGGKFATPGSLDFRIQGETSSRSWTPSGGFKPL